MLRFAVIGNPVSHSKSPFIHTMFGKQTGIKLEYSRIRLEPDEVSSFVKEFFQNNGKGLNVTLPFKGVAFELCDSQSPRALEAAAVNTLFLDPTGKLCGDNTDGIGLFTDIRNNHNVEIAGKNILIIGAGGAVQGLLGALINESPGHVTLINRTESKARKLAQQFQATLPINVVPMSAQPQSRYDVIINGTSLSLSGKVPSINEKYIRPDCFCYDLAYGNQETSFVTWAKSLGATNTADGLGMLVEQGAESFKIWCGIKPETKQVIEALRQSFQ